MRFRRATCLAVFRAIRPLLILRKADILHEEMHVMSRLNELIRETSLAQATGIETAAEVLGTEIRLRRLECGWTQAQLAHRAGLTLSQISRIEHGRVQAHKSTLRKIAQATSALLEASASSAPALP
jgi:DNA-binding XRE family transcriptional regulator